MKKGNDMDILLFLAAGIGIIYVSGLIYLFIPRSNDKKNDNR